MKQVKGGEPGKRGGEGFVVLAGSGFRRGGAE